MPKPERKMPTYQSGDFVKAEFANENTGESEWMWVRVESCDDARRLVFGWLDTEPIIDQGTKIKLGSKLAVSYDNIRQHRKSSDF